MKVSVVIPAYNEELALPQTLERIAQALARATCEAEIIAAYVCTWGAACERVHDIFDEFLVMREIEQGKPLPHIMTTWHNEESLDEALGFALKVALPNATFLASCGLVVVAAVANEEWNAHLPKRLANLTTF